MKCPAQRPVHSSHCRLLGLSGSDVGVGIIFKFGHLNTSNIVDHIALFDAQDECNLFDCSKEGRIYLWKQWIAQVPFTLLPYSFKL